VTSQRMPSGARLSNISKIDLAFQWFECRTHYLVLREPATVL
jgi:hypothetical protein